MLFLFQSLSAERKKLNSLGLLGMLNVVIRNSGYCNQVYQLHCNQMFNRAF